MEDQLDNLKDSLNKWAETVQANTEQKITKALFTAVLNTSQIGGAFSGWLLAISGATIGLLFTDLGSVLQILSVSDLRWALIFLFCSCLAGVVARVAGTYVELFRQMIIELESTLESILREHGVEEEEIKRVAGGLVAPPELELDIERAFAHLLECIPKPQRWLAKRALVRGKADPLPGKSRTRRSRPISA